MLSNTSRGHYLILKRADIPLNPDETVGLVCNLPTGSTLQGVIARNVRGEYGQIFIDKRGHEYTSTSPPETYVIESLGELSTLSARTLEVAKKGPGVNLELWRSMMLGLIPIGLFIAGLVLIWRLRRERRRPQPDAADRETPALIEEAEEESWLD